MKQSQYQPQHQLYKPLLWQECRWLGAAVAATIAVAPGAGFAQAPTYAPEVPAKITTPDTVRARIGTLRFKDGAPDPETVRLAYDQIDFSRGIDAFVRGMSATSVMAICNGLEQAGVKANSGIGITEQLMDARSLFLTPNTTTVYVLQCLNLKDGPMVVRVPPRALGPVDDADFRWVTDVGVTGPYKGAGGAYLFVPPGFTGALPDTGFHVARPRTNRLVIFYRVFVEKGDLAAATANVRSNAFASRDPRTRLFKDRQWLTPFVGGSYQFLSGSERLLDARAMFFYLATGITPAMSEARPGTGSAYALTFRDRAGAYLDGGRTYKVTLPGPIPAKEFWAFSVYDNQTRSLLPTDQTSAGIDSNATGLKRNADGGATIWFGPKAPAGKAANWVQTMPGRGYNLILRLYGPLQPWFNQTWQPGDLEPQT